MRPTTPREGPQLSSWIILNREGEEVAQQRSPRDAHVLDQDDEEEVLGVLSLHPDEVAAFTSSTGNRSMWGSMFRMLDRGALATAAATTAEEEGEEENMDEEEERTEGAGAVGELQDQQQHEEEEQSAAAAAAESTPVPTAEGAQQEEEEKEGRGDNEEGGWWHRVSSLLISHFRAILKTLSDPSSCCSRGSGYSLQDELRLACPYLRRQPRQRVLLVAVVVPVAMVVGVTAAVVLVGVCASGSSSSTSSPSTKRGGGRGDSCLVTSPSSGASLGTAKAPLFRVP